MYITNVMPFQFTLQIIRTAIFKTTTTRTIGRCIDVRTAITNVQTWRARESKREQGQRRRLEKTNAKDKKGTWFNRKKIGKKKTDLCSHLDWFWIFLSNTFHPFDCGAILNQLSVENIATATSNYHGHRKTLAIYFWNERKHNLKSTKSTKQ